MSHSARNWNREKIEKCLEFDLIPLARMNDDKSIHIHFVSVPAGLEYKNPPLFEEFIIDTSAPSYADFLDLLGLTTPGETKLFQKEHPEETSWKIEDLPLYFLNNCFLSVELKHDGKVEFVIRGFYMNKTSVYQFDALSEHGKLLIETSGIKLPGEKIFFHKAQEQFDEFLRTGEEPEWKSLKK